MSEEITMEVEVKSTEEKTVIRTIDLILINKKDGWVKWKIMTYDGDNIISAPEFYKHDIDEYLYGAFHSEATGTYEDIQKKLWTKTKIIDDMPETKDEEIKEKETYKGPLIAF